MGKLLFDKDMELSSLAIACGLCVGFGLFAKAFVLASVAVALLLHPFAKDGEWWVVVPTSVISIAVIVVFSAFGGVSFRSIRGVLSFMVIMGIQFFLFIETMQSEEEV